MTFVWTNAQHKTVIFLHLAIALTASNHAIACGDIHINSANIGQFASYLHSSVNNVGRVIHIGPGTSRNERLIEIPLGEIHPRATIQVTLGIDATHLNTAGVDSDMKIGITDGTNENLQWIVDIGNYLNSPCYVIDGQHDSKKVATGTKAPSTFKMLYTPFYKSGVCETIQDGGYINTGTFNRQLDTTKPLSLRISRHDRAEQYYIYYINVQIF